MRMSDSASPRRSRKRGADANLQLKTVAPPDSGEPQTATLADDIPEEHVNPQLQRLLEMAFWHNQAGNVPSAILACEAALMIDGDSTTALSLLGCLYEKQGELQKAIYAFERVVELNPDSEADQEKLDQIRRGVFTKAVTQPAEYRWMPPALVKIFSDYPQSKVVVAVAAGVLAFVVGLNVIKDRTPAPSELAQSPGVQTAPAPPQSVPVSQPSASAQQDGNAPNMAVTRTAVIPAINQPIDPASPQAAPVVGVPGAYPVLNGPMVPGGHLRTIVGRGRRDVPPVDVAATADPNAPYSTTVKPIEVPSDQVNSAAVQVAPRGDFPQHTIVIGGDGSGPTPTPDQVSDPGQPSETSAPPPASHIYIHVHNEAPTPAAPSYASGGSSNSDASGAPAVMRSNRGADMQSQALKLQQKGQYGSALHDYNVAISAYKQDIATGQAVDEAKRGIEACETGIQICQQSE